VGIGKGKILVSNANRLVDLQMAGTQLIVGFFAVGCLLKRGAREHLIY